MTLTPEDQKLLDEMKAETFAADHALDRKLEAMTKEQRDAYLEEQIDMSQKMASSTPMKEEKQ
jgi:hypothetical protein